MHCLGWEWWSLLGWAPIFYMNWGIIESVTGSVFPMHTLKQWCLDKRVDLSGKVCDFLFVFQVPVIKPMELMVEASPRRIFANAHTYHINSISVNSDQETYLSADDLRINLWHLEITDQSFSILHLCFQIMCARKEIMLLVINLTTECS